MNRRYVKAALLCMCMSVCSPTVLFGQERKVSIDAKNVTLKEILHQIEQQTPYRFSYRNLPIEKIANITINKRGVTVKSVLDDLLPSVNLQSALAANDVIVISEIKSATKKTNKIKGKVVDKAGEPIIGANVVVVGEKTGTITNIDGLFELDVPGNSKLLVSFIGYESKEVAVRNRIQVDVMLEENTEMLDEVVVVGYGTMRKRDLTGAISAVKGTDVSSRRTAQISNALQGAIAGVSVTRDNADPSASPNIKVRGVTTIGDSNPLVIVDGVPSEISLVSPDDVESISVLKDAASAAIYGSRAAAGVILITTKRAKQDEVKLSYNFETGWDKPTELPEYVGVTRYLEMANELRYNDNNAGGWFQTYTEDQVKNWVKLNATDPDHYPITDWQKVLIKSSAPRTTHSLNIVGGGKNVRTTASFRYDKNEGLFVNKNYDQFLVRVNNDINIGKLFEAHVDLSYKRSVGEKPHINPLAIGFRAIPAVYAVRWSNGMWGDVKNGENPLAIITDGGTRTLTNHYLGGKAALDFKPMEGLRLSAIVAPRFNFEKEKVFKKQLGFSYESDPSVIKGYMNGLSNTFLMENRNDNNSITTQFLADYQKTFGKHDVALMLGYEDYYEKYENLAASRDQYELSRFPYLDLGPTSFQTNGGNATEYAYRSSFGRLTYNYDRRYMLQLNVRRDGSSRFAPNNRWVTFPSLSLGWTLSEEKFMKNAHADWLSYLKLRASWGRLGNERIGSYYPYQASLNFANTLFYNGNDIKSYLSVAQQNYAVQNISWETTESWNIGLDASFFNSRLSMTLDIYNKKTKDMLLALEIPKYMGYENPNVNAGDMNTKGFDLELAWRDEIGKFQYSIAANLSDYISRMGNLGNNRFLTDEQLTVEGGEYQEWYGYLSDGLIQASEDLATLPKLNNNVKAGDIKYKDISGPDGKPDGKISPEYDRVLLGGSLPRYMFGLNLSGKYQGFDLSLVFQGVGKQNAYMTPDMVQPLNADWGGVPALIDGNYWSEKNTEAQNLAAKYPRLSTKSKKSNYAMSDYWLFDGRYIRMKNITLGYTLPTALTKKIFMSSARVYVAANDLFCINNYPKGWDPEVSVSGYPITSSLLLGVSVNF